MSASSEASVAAVASRLDDLRVAVESEAGSPSGTRVGAEEAEAGPSGAANNPHARTGELDRGGEEQERTRDSSDATVGAPRRYPNGQDPRLRYREPYWFPYQTFVKERWRGRQLLEVISTEFRDRSVEYYRHALESGVTRINGVIASPLYVLKGGDRLENTVHRHEPPVANDPVKILHIDREREFMVISKPGSVPVHATGRYMCHTVLDLLEFDHDIHAYAVNRLDRLTSGLMILALSSKASRDLAFEFQKREVKKEYVARVRGRFPDEEIEVDQPLLTVDRQMGLVIVTPEGKEARTIFRKMSYDAERDESVVRCFPQTGRTHQIRVHLQYLGHPIANDPLYSMPAVWGQDVGRGGVDLVPEAGSLEPADILAQRNLGTSASASSSLMTTPAVSSVPTPALRPLPSDEARLSGREELPDAAAVSAKLAVGAGRVRETENIEVASPVRLSRQAKEIIARLRRMKDEAEDWIKWKEVIFTDDTPAAPAAGDDTPAPPPPPPPHDRSHPSHGANQRIPLLQHRVATGIPRTELPADFRSPLRRPAHLPPGFCGECFVPLPDDPDPETLFIYLHALSYTTERLGRWSTPLPRWAGEGWDGDWRGWVDGADVREGLTGLGMGMGVGVEKGGDESERGKE